MTEPEVFILANRTLGPIVDQIKDDQWDLMAPPMTSWRPNQTLRNLVNYHSYDDACVPNVLAGETKDEYGTKHTIDDDLLGDDPKGNYAKYNKAAIKAVEGFQDLDRQVHLSYGDFPSREYLEHISLFRGLRSYDIAKFIGADTKLPDELVEWLWNYVNDNEDMLRQNRIISDAVSVPDSAPLQDRALAFTGRQP